MMRNAAVLFVCLFLHFICTNGQNPYIRNLPREGRICKFNPCKNEGVCVLLPEPYCMCLLGYSGSLCEDYNSRLSLLHADICMTMPCMNSGTCVSQGSSYKCNCPAGFTGKNCERILKCKSDFCEHAVSCQITAGEYHCECEPGWSGQQCNQRSGDLDHVCSPNPCVNNGTCSTLANQTDRFHCSCLSGFTGTHCEEDINECNGNKELCNNGVCVNTQGSYQCFCRPGFSSNNCSTDLNECLSHPCSNGGTCEDKINDFNCICPLGFTGKHCDVNVDECISNPCLNGATCINNNGSFTCSCPIGVAGKLCETNTTGCESFPCQNMGLCSDGINGHYCNCTGTGFEGNQCEIDINDCLCNTCLNNGVCIDGPNDYYCNCSVGFSGKNCENAEKACESNPCQYGGTCIDRFNLKDSKLANKTLKALAFQYKLNYTDNRFKCLCPTDTTGVYCETIISDSGTFTGWRIFLIFLVISLGSLLAFLFINRNQISKFKSNILNIFNRAQTSTAAIIYTPDPNPERLI